MKSSATPHALVVASLLASACAPTSHPPATPPRRALVVTSVPAAPANTSPYGPTATPDDATGTTANEANPTNTECVVGVWSSLGDRDGDAATLILNYPRASPDYAMSRYMDAFPIVVTPESRPWVDALPARASAAAGPAALLFRGTSSEPWRVVTDASACPGDPSEALAWSKGG